MEISKEGESVSIIARTVRDRVRRELEGWRVGKAGRRGYSGERRGCRGRWVGWTKAVGMLFAQAWRGKSPSLDTLTWCHFEKLIHLLGLCFDHWQLSHLSWGLRKKWVQLYQLPLRLIPCHPEGAEVNYTWRIRVRPKIRE